MNLIELPAPESRVIFRRAQARIDHLWATALPFELKVDAHLDVLMWVAWELGRIDCKRRLSVLVGRVKHGVES